MSFGKRPSTASATPQGADPHGRRRILPDEAWQGESGEMLRGLGLSPDDESNLAPNAASINAALARSRAAHESALAEAQRRVEAALPGASVRPFFLIPDAVWNSRAGAFLMGALELYPYDDWNVIYLAGDEATALALDLAPHPNGDIPAFVEAAQSCVDEALGRLRQAHEEAAVNRAYDDYNVAREEARQSLKAAAEFLSRRLIEAWARNGPARGGRA